MLHTRNARIELTHKSLIYEDQYIHLFSWAISQFEIKIFESYYIIKEKKILKHVKGPYKML